jgi:hypothetical protein
MPKTSEDLLFTEGQSGDTVTTLSRNQAESLRATNTVINLTTPQRPASSRCTNLLYTNWNSYAENHKFYFIIPKQFFLSLSRAYFRSGFEPGSSVTRRTQFHIKRTQHIK